MHHRSLSSSKTNHKKTINQINRKKKQPRHHLLKVKKSAIFSPKKYTKDINSTYISTISHFSPSLQKYPLHYISKQYFMSQVDQKHIEHAIVGIGCYWGKFFINMLNN
mgnify:CR=1 FL=1